MIKIVALTYFILPILLSACASPRYACGVPDGVGCTPLSEVHRKALDGSLKSQAVHDNRGPVVHNLDDEDSIITDAPHPASTLSPASTELAISSPSNPQLVPPQTMRVWVAPWSDDGGTWHDETYLYLRLDNGHWFKEAH